MLQKLLLKMLAMKYMTLTFSMSLVLISAGCGGNIKFEKTAEELLAQMERDGAIVPLASSMSPSQISSAGSLTSFAADAVVTSPYVASAKRQMMAAQARVAEAEREFYPQISLTSDEVRTHQIIKESSNPSLEGSDTRYDTSNVALTANLRLLDLSMSAAIVAARSEAEAREADFEAEKQDLLRGILDAYADAAEAIERWRLAEAEVQYFNELSGLNSPSPTRGFCVRQRGLLLPRNLHVHGQISLLLLQIIVYVWIVCAQWPMKPYVLTLQWLEMTPRYHFRPKFLQMNLTALRIHQKSARWQDA